MTEPAAAVAFSNGMHHSAGTRFPLRRHSLIADCRTPQTDPVASWPPMIATAFSNSEIPMRSLMPDNLQQDSVICQQKTDKAVYQNFDILQRMEGIGTRLRKARKEAGLTQDQLAKSAGITQTAVAELESGRSRDSAKIVELAAAVGRSPEWLRTGKDKSKSLVAVHGDDEAFQQIGRYDTAFSMGPGALAEEDPRPLGYWMVETQWLNSLTRSAPDHLAIVRASGDSMVPTLLSGDWVLLDRMQTRVTREGIYGIRVGDDIWIKRLSLNLRLKTVRIISDNPTTPVQDVEESDLTIIGRVISLVARQM